MTCRFAILSIATFAVTAALAQTSETAKAPANLKEAESTGLQRVNMGELRALIPGVHQVRGPTGTVKRTMKADGRLEREGFRETTGAWRFDDSRNAYCIELVIRRGFQKECYGVFRSPQEGHVFDYDLATGFYSRTWTPLKEQQGP